MIRTTLAAVIFFLGPLGATGFPPAWAAPSPDPRGEQDGPDRVNGYDDRLPQSLKRQDEIEKSESDAISQWQRWHQRRGIDPIPDSPPPFDRPPTAPGV